MNESESPGAGDSLRMNRNHPVLASRPKTVRRQKGSAYPETFPDWDKRPVELAEDDIYGPGKNGSGPRGSMGRGGEAGYSPIPDRKPHQGDASRLKFDFDDPMQKGRRAPLVARPEGSFGGDDRGLIGDPMVGARRTGGRNASPDARMGTGSRMSRLPPRRMLNGQMGRTGSPIGGVNRKGSQQRPGLTTYGGEFTGMTVYEDEDFGSETGGKTRAKGKGKGHENQVSNHERRCRKEKETRTL